MKTVSNKSEKGSTLLAILFLMAITTIFLLAAAPSIVIDIQREKELESIRRGEEVAEAIRRYVVHHGGAKLPDSMDDLLEGLAFGTKKVQILRPSAAIDPLSEDGKWRLVKADSKTFINFAKRVQTYNNGVLPSNPSQLFDRFAFVLVNTLNTETEEGKKEAEDEIEEDVGDETENVQFIGVISKSKSKSVITYFGIENHSKWVFTPMFRGSGTNQIRSQSSGNFAPPSTPLPIQNQ
jgi:type II secretory pathway pseudopilin PulG